MGDGHQSIIYHDISKIILDISGIITLDIYIYTVYTYCYIYIYDISKYNDNSHYPLKGLPLGDGWPAKHKPWHNATWPWHMNVSTILNETNTSSFFLVSDEYLKLTSDTKQLRSWWISYTIFKFESQQPEKNNSAAGCIPTWQWVDLWRSQQRRSAKIPWLWPPWLIRPGADTHGVMMKCGVCARHRCPTLTWSPPSSPCSWTEQIGGCWLFWFYKVLYILYFKTNGTSTIFRL